MELWFALMRQAAWPVPYSGEQSRIAVGTDRQIPDPSDLPSGNLSKAEHQSMRIWGSGGVSPTIWTGSKVTGDVSVRILAPGDVYSLKRCNLGGQGPEYNEGVMFTIRAKGSTHAVAYDPDRSPRAVTQYGEVAGTLTARHDSSPCVDRGMNMVFDGTGDGADYVVRRLTPIECERLMGFPDRWTDVAGAKDSPRYKALGNSMAVPCMRWIGIGIERVEAATSGSGS